MTTLANQREFTHTLKRSKDCKSLAWRTETQWDMTAREQEMHEALHHAIDTGLAAVWAVAIWLFKRWYDHREALEKQREDEKLDYQQRIRDLEAAHGIACKPKHKAHKSNS